MRLPNKREEEDSLHLMNVEFDAFDRDPMFPLEDLSRGRIPGRLQTRTVVIALPLKIYMKVRFV